MPSTTIETKQSHSDEHVTAIIDAVFAAQVEALGVPDDYRNVRYIEHVPGRFVGPPTKDDRHVHIEIALFAGRTEEVKTALFDATVARLGELGHERSQLSIVLHEQPAENWFYGA